MKALEVIDLGTLSYEETYFLQKKIVNDIKQNHKNDHLLFVEHPAVFTIGRNGSMKNMLVSEDSIKGRGVEIIDIDRGGDITFHGEGQLVIYPIFDLARGIKDVRLFINNLQRVLELTISEYGLTANKDKKYTGLWVGEAKIAFIGIGISNWITYHGISINANVDLEYFSMIRPCGIDGLRVDNLQNMLNRTVDIDTLKEKFLEKCCEVFGFERIHNSTKESFVVKEGVA